MLAGIAAFYAISNDIRVLVLAWLFPTGLCALFGTPIRPIIGIPLLILAYAIYPVIFAAFIKARTWRRFSILCILLASVLLLNMVGCRNTHERFSNLQ